MTVRLKTEPNRTVNTPRYNPIFVKSGGIPIWIWIVKSYDFMIMFGLND
jgi:hypothetical protein